MKLLFLLMVFNFNAKAEFFFKETESITIEFLKDVQIHAQSKDEVFHWRPTSRENTNKYCGLHFTFKAKRYSQIITSGETITLSFSKEIDEVTSEVKGFFFKNEELNISLFLVARDRKEYQSFGEAVLYGYIKRMLEEECIGFKLSEASPTEYIGDIKYITNQ